MKNTDNKKQLIDPIVEAKKYSQFQEYSQDAHSRVNLAIQLYNFRMQRGFSQTTLAKKAFTTQKVISKVENADMNMSWDLIVRIFNALGLTLKIIDGGVEPVTQSNNLFDMGDYGKHMLAQWELINKTVLNQNIKQVIL